MYSRHFTKVSSATAVSGSGWGILLWLLLLLGYLHILNPRFSLFWRSFTSGNWSFTIAQLSSTEALSTTIISASIPWGHVLREIKHCSRKTNIVIKDDYRKLHSYELLKILQRDPWRMLLPRVTSSAYSTRPQQQYHGQWWWPIPPSFQLFKNVKLVVSPSMVELKAVSTPDTSLFLSFPPTCRYEDLQGLFHPWVIFCPQYMVMSLKLAGVFNSHHIANVLHNADQGFIPIGLYRSRIFRYLKYYGSFAEIDLLAQLFQTMGQSHGLRFVALEDAIPIARLYVFQCRAVGTFHWLRFPVV